jgi:hypothetical protein
MPDERLNRVRADALPEHIHYQDQGCDIHPQCLTCPLTRCRYDEPGGLRALLNAQRDRHVISLKHQGESVDAIARRFGLSRRTVFRILSARDRHRGNGHCRPSLPNSRKR